MSVHSLTIPIVISQQERGLDGVDFAELFYFLGNIQAVLRQTKTGLNLSGNHEGLGNLAILSLLY